MNILITGSSGFIAPHIIQQALNNNWNVIGVDIVDNPYDFKKNFKFIKSDVRDLEVKDLLQIDFVYHLGFVTNIPNSIKKPVSTTNDNIDMTVYLLDLCTKANIKKFFFPSTASLYGNNTDHVSSLRQSEKIMSIVLMAIIIHRFPIE